MSITASAASTASQAAIAQSGAMAAARIAKCHVVLNNFDANHATVSEMRQYAFCVESIYPDEMSAGAVWLFKGLFVAALIGLVIGIYFSRQTYRCGDWTDHFSFGVFCFFFSPAVLLLIAGLLYGVWWLVT